ncbi:MAG TPA: Uma2 family endonuclease [Bryobacteraceae bacterium]|jgi:Uma2 family endonuclease|nr:Uma2 family endonuclease [Bryobacteraceae bacterium]
MATQPVTRLTEEEYLRLERVADHKSEFVDGEIFPIAGGTLRHAAVASTWTGILLSEIARGSGYVFSSDARIRTGSSGSYVYPNVSVTIGPPKTHEGIDDVLINPTAIVEVLSPSTADYDHGKRFHLYREIPTFADYLLVHTDTAFVEH